MANPKITTSPFCMPRRSLRAVTAILAVLSVTAPAVAAEDYYATADASSPAGFDLWCASFIRKLAKNDIPA